MANNVLKMAMNVLQELPALITAGDEVVQLVTSTLSTLQAAQSQGRDPTQAEWDAVHAQIDALTGRLDRPETLMDVPGVGDAAARGDGTGAPSAKPEDVTGTAANPDPAGVNPGPMFNEAHGAPGSTNVSTSTGGVVNTGGAFVAPVSADEQKALDDHPRAAPSVEASQQNPVNPLTGVAQGTPTPATDAQAAFVPDPANSLATQLVMHPVGEMTINADPNAPVGDVPQATAAQIVPLTTAGALPIDNTVSGVGAAPASAPDTFAGEKANAERDFADGEAKARTDLDDAEATARRHLGLN